MWTMVQQPSRAKRRKRNKGRHNLGIKQQLNRARHIMGEPSACHWCGTSLPYYLLTVDHLIPLSDGGRDSASNAVLSCRDCNTLRSQHDAYRRGEMKRRPREIGTLSA